MRDGQGTDWNGGGLFLADGHGDPWLKYYMTRSLTPTEAESEAAPRITGEALFAGVLRFGFGHFLTESIGRLWALDKLGSEMPIVYITNVNAKRPITGTAQAFFELFGLTERINLVRADTSFDCIWNATDLYGPLRKEPLHPRMRRWFLSQIPKSEAKFSPKIYISRKGIPLEKGRYLGETFVEAGLADEGYQIFRPEENSLADQINAYSNAQKIVLAESSAFHLVSIVAKKDANIAIIRRRPVFGNWIENSMSDVLTKNVSMITALKSTWKASKGENYNAVSEIDFGKMWEALRDLGLINTNFGKPVPTIEEIASERTQNHGDRTSEFEIQASGVYRRSKRLVFRNKTIT